MDFTILKRAGVPQELFAELLKVSTPAVNKWVGGGKVHPARVRAVEKLLKVFETALDIGTLPSKAAKREDRRREIKVVLLTALRPPPVEE